MISTESSDIPNSLIQEINPTLSKEKPQEFIKETTTRKKSTPPNDLKIHHLPDYQLNLLQDMGLPICIKCQSKTRSDLEGNKFCPAQQIDCPLM